MRDLVAKNDDDFDITEGGTFKWRLQVSEFGKLNGSATGVAYGEGTGTFPTIPKPEPTKPDDDKKDDKTTDETKKDGETTDNASFIAATSLTIGAMTAMLAF